MAIVALRHSPSGTQPEIARRVRDTVALLERRGYSLPAAGLGRVCLGGPLAEGQVRRAAAAAGVAEHDGIMCSPALASRAAAVARRQAEHAFAAPTYLGEAEAFARRLAGLFPFVIAVSIAGSLSSGGFAVTDDVDLNLVVEDGYRHLAYFCLNLLGIVHAWRHRRKPVDALSARPITPRVMTANLVLDRSQCFPLLRTDADMAYELLASDCLVGAGLMASMLTANPTLVEHFPQLADRWSGAVSPVRPRLPAAMFPRALDHPARWVGRAAWRFLQWTRRGHPEALARIAYVRRTMRPYTLFDDGR